MHVLENKLQIHCKYPKLLLLAEGDCGPDVLKQSSLKCQESQRNCENITLLCFCVFTRSHDQPGICYRDISPSYRTEQVKKKKKLVKETETRNLQE